MPVPRLRYFLLLAAATLWMAALILPAWTAGQGLSWHTLLYLPFAQVCHQMSERSFFLFGHPLAVCHRCIGIYLGFWIGLVVFPFLSWFPKTLLKKPRLLLLFALPTTVDFFLNNVPLSRFATGVLAGFPVALFVWVAVEEIALPLRRLQGVHHESR